MLLNKYLPGYHFREVHSIKLHGFFTRIYDTMFQCNFGKNALVKVLFRLRGMPTEVYTIEQLAHLGFIKLHEAPGEEVIFGRITDSPMFNTCKTIASPKEFIQNSEPGIIKAVINFRLREVSNSQHIISTETRVWCGSKSMKSKFRLYWFFIKPFSKVIRKSMLRQIKEEVLHKNKITKLRLG